MQEFEHLQSLWQSHTVDVKISADEMLAQAKKEVNSIRSRSLMNIIGMALSFIAIAALWYFFDFQSWTTHAGITIIITAIAISTFTLYRSHRLISNNDFTAHPKEFLSSLKTFQLSRYMLYNKLYWFYAAALTIGGALFFFENLSPLSIWVKASLIVFTLFWMIFSATILRRGYMKKEKERIDLLIEKFERISEQFNTGN
jgi:membrane protein YdbS with pleckstrin-like domain